MHLPETPVIRASYRNIGDSGSIFSRISDGSRRTRTGGQTNEYVLADVVSRLVRDRDIGTKNAVRRKKKKNQEKAHIFACQLSSGLASTQR